MPQISIVINCDTRISKDTNDGLFNGVVNEDFLTDGVWNKIKFFDGFEKEVIVFIDEHNRVGEKTLEYLRTIVDTVVIRRHTGEPKFNDWNYWNALAMCRGDVICHFDQDVSAFAENKNVVDDLLKLLDSYDFVSYPSQWSPAPDHNDNYDYWWCSTRFFICKRELLDLTEIKKCLQDSDYLYGKYPASVKNPWMEHIIGLHAKYNGKQKGVYYPPMDYDNILIFTWERYETYTLRRLNEQPFNEIKDWVISKGGIFYPNNIKI